MSKNKEGSSYGREGSSKIPGGPETPSSLDMNDSQSNVERLREDTSFVILPEVSDIPRQESITSIDPRGEMNDTTASSDGEEGIKGGADILDEEEDIEIVMGTEADVTNDDLILLGAKDQDLDDELTENEGLDDTDFEGDPLNEAATDLFSTGDDLDIPGRSSNNDEPGEEDEENDYYSLGSEDNDNVTEGTP